MRKRWHWRKPCTCKSSWLCGEEIQPWTLYYPTHNGSQWCWARSVMKSCHSTVFSPFLSCFSHLLGKVVLGKFLTIMSYTRFRTAALKGVIWSAELNSASTNQSLTRLKNTGLKTDIWAELIYISLRQNSSAASCVRNILHTDAFENSGCWTKQDEKKCVLSKVSNSGVLLAFIWWV